MFFWEADGAKIGRSIETAGPMAGEPGGSGGSHNK